MRRNSLPLYAGLLLGAWIGLGIYVWLTAGVATPRERELCKRVYERGVHCLIVRKLAP